MRELLDHEESLLKKRQEYMAQRIIRPFVDKLIAQGVLPKPVSYSVEWPGQGRKQKMTMRELLDLLKTATPAERQELKEWLFSSTRIEPCAEISSVTAGILREWLDATEVDAPAVVISQEVLKDGTASQAVIEANRAAVDDTLREELDQKLLLDPAPDISTPRENWPPDSILVTDSDGVARWMSANEANALLRREMRDAAKRIP